MSEADKMFEKIGYKKEIGSTFVYGDITSYKINNSKKYKSISFYFARKEIQISGKINLEELKAINEKVRELGWIIKGSENI